MFKREEDVLRLDAFLPPHLLPEPRRRREGGGEGSGEGGGEGGGGKGNTATYTPFLYCLNLVRTRMDDSVRRGAIVKALAVCTRWPYFQILRSALVLGLEAYFDNPTVDVLAHIYHTINTVDIPSIPQVSASERRLIRTSRNESKRRTEHHVLASYYLRYHTLNTHRYYHICTYMHPLYMYIHTIYTSVYTPLNTLYTPYICTRYTCIYTPYIHSNTPNTHL